MSTSKTTTTDHHPALVHHFDSMEQQQQASTFGMWVFLLTELMMFGGLFASYLIYRIKFYDAWEAGSSSIDVTWGFINTLVLIGSSFTMAMAVWAAQKGADTLAGYCWRIHHFCNFFWADAYSEHHLCLLFWR